MGCGATALQKQFQDNPPHQVADVVHRATNFGEFLNQRIQIIGRVGHNGSVLESPFGQHKGVAIKVAASVPSGGHGQGANKSLFVARSYIDFKLVGTDNSFVVVRAGKPVKCTVALQTTEQIFNIMRDDRAGCLQSGGSKPGQISQALPRPHAMQFWKDFNDGKDSPMNMTAVSGSGMSAGLNRPREAVESVLKVSDAVAVIGILRKVDNGFVVEADEDSLSISNSAIAAPAVKSCPEVLGLSPEDASEVLQMKP
eukprot:TRINITY_DN53323_c0_g1_i1.p1 TRINITY_DN53323_c0_g1~~TRINITY_DN53323_c0_g1_i1.p1  ORF type:complete len:255 (+),score=37.13 TRINITY_DN53323_c0_g1_i1:78-842(+)